MTDANTTELLAETSWIQRLALRLVRDPNVADDLVQDTVVSALESRPDAGRPLRAWLGTVLRNHLGKHRTRETHRAERQQAVSREEGTSSTYEVVAKASLQRDLVEAVLGLEEPYRATILLRFFERLSHREIARRMGVTPATVHSRLTRGLARLRRRLDREYGDRRAWVVAFAPILPRGLAALGTGVFSMSTVVTSTLFIAASSVAVLSAWNPLGTEPDALSPVVQEAAPLEVAESELQLDFLEPAASREVAPTAGVLADPEEGEDDVWKTELFQELTLGRDVRSLRLNAGAGSIEVVEGTAFSVTAKVRADLEVVPANRLTSAFEDHVRVSEEEGVVKIEDAHAHAKERGWSVSLVITTPRPLGVTANSGAGSVVVRHAAGSVTLNSGAGKVAVLVSDRTLDAVFVNSGAGAAEVRVAGAAKVTANTGAGGVEVVLRDVEGTEAVSLSSGTGSLKLVVPNGVAGTFEMESGLGRITVPASLGLEVVRKGLGDEVSGTVGYGEARYELSTGTGSITVDVGGSVH